KAKASAQVIRLDDGEMVLSRGEHEHRKGFDKDRTGTPMEPRRESYVEAKLNGKGCRILTLFNVQSAEAGEQPWMQTPEGWQTGGVQCRLTEGGLELISDGGRVGLE